MPCEEHWQGLRGRWASDAQGAGAEVYESRTCAARDVMCRLHRCAEDSLSPDAITRQGRTTSQRGGRSFRLRHAAD